MNNNWTREQTDERMENKLFEEGKKELMKMICHSQAGSNYYQII
jgi:hypothetical protein